MHAYDTQKGKCVSITSGEIHVTRENCVIISTVLGSCVSACLFDPVTGIAGMNHFMLSNHRYTNKMPLCLTEAGRYGVFAMEILINEMLKQGALRKNLVAKAFGGGSIMRTGERNDNFFCVGDVNAKFILEFLDTERIHLAAHDLGGDTGRVVHFNTRTYAASVKKIQQTDSHEVVSKEWSLWKSQVEAHLYEKNRIDLWRA